jgi:hypothetical protein
MSSQRRFQRAVGCWFRNFEAKFWINSISRHRSFCCSRLMAMKEKKMIIAKHLDTTTQPWALGMAIQAPDPRRL